jgi:hypothetical protein
MKLWEYYVEVVQAIVLAKRLSTVEILKHLGQLEDGGLSMGKQMAT